MFALSLAVLALVGSALAGPLKRFDGLTIDVRAPSSVASLDELSLTATVTNTNSEDVKILKYGTVLDSLPTRSFFVSKDDAEVPFAGVKVSVELSDDAYTTIKSGESVSVVHNIAALYDFESAGTGIFTFAPKVELKVGAADEAISEKVQSTANTVTVEIGNVAKRHLEEKRATVSCSNTSYRSFISSSYTEGKALASLAASYINSNGRSSLFTAYWGQSSTSTVASKFTAVANENSSSRTLNCSDPYGVCDGNVIAYTLIATTNIYYCSIFYNEVASTRLCSGTTVASRNVRGGTTLHELTHAVADTDDVTYGCSADQALSDSQSVINADNYNCFATQVYQNTQC
ncbi:Deuterolysin metalloprotease family-domain-containing protein [Schizophyllum amplum]|uniref:Neutral protease 2 n=1 Tax=Schizophyllum amplum TaxID=97359 RepID=A0A550CRL5_9AGAR|nr:Deuterolysin metalloprotease family-domain-containing protein [Auriculariopsis ampla]